LLAQHISEQHFTDPVVLLGDFNAGPSSSTLRHLLGATTIGFVDAWRAAHPDAAECGTFSGWRDTHGNERIDHLLIAGDLTVVACDVDDRKREGRWPSDHAPVRATLR